MFEPTVETGFNYLQKIQQFTGVSYGEDELQLVYRLYLARKKYAGDAPIVAMLDQVSTLLAQLEVGEATELLELGGTGGRFRCRRRRRRGGLPGLAKCLRQRRRFFTAAAPTGITTA